ALTDGSDGPEGPAGASAGQAADYAENLAGSGIVDRAAGKPHSSGPSAPDSGSPTATEGSQDSTAPVTTDPTTTAEAADPVEATPEQLAARLLRLHAERMRVLARERRTRDRFTALHPEVPVAEVAALPLS
ncbi:hypothetical protein ADK38_41770, partial [Streptomyces varsoviensis]